MEVVLLFLTLMLRFGFIVETHVTHYLALTIGLNVVRVVVNVVVVDDVVTAVADDDGFRIGVYRSDVRSLK